MTEELKNETIPQEIEPSLLPEENPSSDNKAQAIIIGVVAVVLLGLIITGAVMLLSGSSETAGQWRDVFIIFIALEMLIIGAAIVILMVQLAILINLLQNEIRPILETTNETANTMRGTAEFLSKNISEPIIKLNGYLAGLQRLINLAKGPGK